MAVDMELKKAFLELQKKMVDTQQQMRISDVQIDSLSKEKRKIELTEKEIGALPEDTRLYRSVGRMFLFKPKPDVMQILKNEHKDADSKIKELEAKKTYLERSVKSSEENLREMVSQRQRR